MDTEALVKIAITQGTRQTAKVKAASMGVTMVEYFDLLVRKDTDTTPGPHYYAVTRKPRLSQPAITNRSPAVEDAQAGQEAVK